MDAKKARRVIHIHDWDKFQHSDATKRGNDPKWIKSYTRLLSDEDYLALSPRRRAILHGLWLEYARSGRRLPEHTATLSRRLALRVLKSDLDALNHAGFIEFRQDAVMTAASLDKTREEKRREERLSTSNEADNVLDFQKESELVRILALLAGTDEQTLDTLRRESSGLAVGWICRVRESIARRPAKTYGVGYAVNALRSAKKEAA